MEAYLTFDVISVRYKDKGTSLMTSQWRFRPLSAFLAATVRPSKGAVTCAVCPESARLVTFLIGNVSTGVVTWSALRCGASGESGKKVAAAPLSKTAAAAAAAETWFAKLPLDYMLHNRFPWKQSGRRSSMWPPYSLRRNLSAAACRPCDRSFTLCLYGDLGQINVIAWILKLRKRFRMSQILFEHGINSLPLVCFRGYGNLSTLSIAIPRLAFGRAWYCDAACG